MNNKLNILWTTDNRDTVFNMLSMYAINSVNKDWWEHVNIILWGASVKLVANDTQVQTENHSPNTSKTVSMYCICRRN
ncbi:hypothetical protein [Bacteroides graminisolvens]|uniref:hypothetical protein n=1 Tax=Bacteroides graminisolvens TaxID=477666 RepID=UPI0029C80D54|nr:hypothetical protein [Bacteroides graminisolvens]